MHWVAPWQFMISVTPSRDGALAPFVLAYMIADIRRLVKVED